MHDITTIIEQELKHAKGERGVLFVHILHTSAALTINENADPDVKHDFEEYLNHVVPENLENTKHHAEGPDDMPAHVKTSLLGNSISVPLEDGRLVLGIWQGIFLYEFRNKARSRTIFLSILN